MTNQLYAIPLQTLRTERNSEVPESVVGAYVMCYAAANDLEAALTNAAAALYELGWRIDDVTANANEIPPQKWTDYLKAVWPDYLNHFPSEAVLKEVIAEGSVFFGPFATYNVKN